MKVVTKQFREVVIKSIVFFFNLFGNELIKICREVLHEVDKIKILRQKMEGKYKERIRLGIIPTISAYIIPSLFPIWQKIMENIQVEIEEMKTIIGKIDTSSLVLSEGISKTEFANIIVNYSHKNNIKYISDFTIIV